MRYADDFAVFCPSQEKAIEAQELLSHWLGARGLRLSDDKTHIRHLQEGFDFLGYHIRHYPAPNSSRYGYKLLTKPSANSIQDLKRKLKGLWRKHVGTSTVPLINDLNPVIRGWSQYFRIGAAKETFSDLDSFMYYRAKRYAKRRHPSKSGQWRMQKYWGPTLGHRDRWVFQDKVRHVTLRQFSWTKIVRHRLVPSTYSPDDSTLQDYWRQRQTKLHVGTRRQRRLARQQQGRCPICHQHLDNGEVLHVHHVTPRKLGGTEDLSNLWLVHHTCHSQIHSTKAPLEVRRLLEPYPTPWHNPI